MTVSIGNPMCERALYRALEESLVQLHRRASLIDELINVRYFPSRPILFSSFGQVPQFLCVIIIRPTRREKLRESAYAKR